VEMLAGDPAQAGAFTVAVLEQMGHIDQGASSQAMSSMYGAVLELWIVTLRAIPAIDLSLPLRHAVDILWREDNHSHLALQACTTLSSLTVLYHSLVLT